MSDIKSVEERSRNMSAIKCSDTQIEKYVRNLLFSNGYRYRLQAKNIPGHADIWLKKYNTAIFINGCFWHRHNNCKLAYTPKSNTDFWNKKFENNIQRDNIVHQQLRESNIKCLVIWECSIKKAWKKGGNPQQLLDQMRGFLISDKLYDEI